MAEQNAQTPPLSDRAQRAQSNKVPVKFLKSWRGYGIGETAGFTPEIAKQLVDEKFAEKVALPEKKK